MVLSEPLYSDEVVQAAIILPLLQMKKLRPGLLRVTCEIQLLGHQVDSGNNLGCSLCASKKGKRRITWSNGVTEETVAWTNILIPVNEGGALCREGRAYCGV